MRPRTPQLARRAAAGLALLVLAPATFANGTADNGHCYLERWAPNDLVAQSKAGTSVAFDGDVAVVGAPGREAAYVYERSGGTWAQVQVLESPASPDAWFGYSVGLSGSFLAVGAIYHDDDGDNADEGAVYLYQRQPGGWALEETFIGASSDFLGFDVDVDDTEELRVAASATGSAGGVVYLFELTGAGWTTRDALTLPGTGFLGASLDLEGDTLVAGDWADDTLGSNVGAVHRWIVTPHPADVEYVQTILPSDVTHHFGWDVAIDGKNRLVVGAPNDDEAANLAGAVYVYECVPSPAFPFYEYGDEHKIVPCGVSIDANFGTAVAVDGNRIAVGASKQALGAAGGTVYVYERSFLGGTPWLLEDVVIPDDGLPSDFFGTDVAIAGQHVLASAPNVDQGVVNGGASYLISLSGSAPGGGECPCDTLAFVTSYGTGKPGAMGAPALTATPPPVPGQTTTFRLWNVPTGIQPILFWGTIPAAIPFDGGTLLMADPNGEWMPVAGALNFVGLQWNVPNDLGLCGSETVFQGLFLDPGGWGQFKTAQSNGLHTVVGF